MRADRRSSHPPVVGVVVAFVRVIAAVASGGALLRRRARDEVGLRTGGQHEDQVEIGPVNSRDGAVDVAEAAIEEASPPGT